MYNYLNYLILINISVMYQVNRFNGVFPAPLFSSHSKRKNISYDWKFTVCIVSNQIKKTVFRKITARNVFLLCCLCGLHAETNI